MGRKKAPLGPLGAFGGYPVAKVGVVFRNAGDGLSDSLDVDPIKHETGVEYYWVMKTVGGPIDHEPLNAKGKKATGEQLVHDFEAYRRVEDMMTLQVIEVTRDQVQEWLEESEVRVAAALAEREAAERRAKGEFSMDDAIAEQNGGGFDPDAEVPPEDA